MITTDGLCRTTWISCSEPLGYCRCSTSTENTRPLNTIAIAEILEGPAKAGHYVLHRLRFVASPQFIEDLLQIVRQVAREFHAASVGRMLERQPGSMQERTLQMGDSVYVARHTAMHAAV